MTNEAFARVKIDALLAAQGWDTLDTNMELAADRKRELQYLADRVEVLAAGANVLPLRAA